jgi:hypothetical protein
VILAAPAVVNKLDFNCSSAYIVLQPRTTLKVHCWGLGNLQDAVRKMHLSQFFTSATAVQSPRARKKITAGIYCARVETIIGKGPSVVSRNFWDPVVCCFRKGNFTPAHVYIIFQLRVYIMCSGFLDVWFACRASRPFSSLTNNAKKRRQQTQSNCTCACKLLKLQFLSSFNTYRG